MLRTFPRYQNECSWGGNGYRKLSFLWHHEIPRVIGTPYQAHRIPGRAAERGVIEIVRLKFAFLVLSQKSILTRSA